MTSILVGLDGSPASSAALRWADWFARATGADLRVAHAWQHGRSLEPLLDPATGVSGVEEFETGIDARLREIVTQDHEAAAVTDYRVLRGDTAGSLVREAQRARDSLLVVGARGAGGALRTLLGSVSRQVTQCPTQAVAVVPDDLTLPRSDSWSMVVGVDGSTGSARALRWAADAATRGGGTVVTVHALEPPVPDLTRDELTAVTDEMRRRVDEEWCAPLRRVGVSYTVVIDRRDAFDAITRAADAAGPACVVAGSRGLGPLSQRLLGSVTHRLVREMLWPVVVVPAPRDCPVWSSGLDDPAD